MILLHILTFILFFLMFIIIVLLRHGRGVSALMTVRMIVIQRECDCCLDLDLTGVSIELLFCFYLIFCLVLSIWWLMLLITSSLSIIVDIRVLYAQLSKERLWRVVSP